MTHRYGTIYNNNIITIGNRNFTAEDISVLGFDGISISQRVIPRLTTVWQPIAQFVTKILDAFQNPEERFPNMEIVLPYTILEGGTCIPRDKGQKKD